jgi:Uma2 family endonuclease
MACAGSLVPGVAFLILVSMSAMSLQIPTASDEFIDYPESDGQPMAENTLQFQWIVTIQGNLDGLYAGQINVFIAGDLFWYPVQGHPEINQAPDALVVFGRPRGHRGSYRQWEEGGIAPQVVFEVLSPSNRPEEMNRKFNFYEKYGVEEYYVYDPVSFELNGWLRDQQRLRPIVQMDGWVSPRLQIRFDLSGGELVIYRPDGERFLTFTELMQQKQEAKQLVREERLARQQAERRAEQERLNKEQAEHRAQQERLEKEQAEHRAQQERLEKEQAEHRAQQERLEKERAEHRAQQQCLDKEQAERLAEEALQRAARLAEQLRALGVDPQP